MKYDTFLEPRDSEHVKCAVQSHPIKETYTLIRPTNMGEYFKVEKTHVGHSHYLIKVKIIWPKIPMLSRSLCGDF